MKKFKYSFTICKEKEEWEVFKFQGENGWECFQIERFKKWSTKDDKLMNYSKLYFKKCVE